MVWKKKCPGCRVRVASIPNRDEFVLVRLCKCQRSGVAMLSLSFGSSLLLLVALVRWLDNGSKSWVRPHENTNDDSEWMWVSKTIACTISDNDQLFGPLVNFCIRTKKRGPVKWWADCVCWWSCHRFSWVHTSMCSLFSSHGRCAKILLIS